MPNVYDQDAGETGGLKNCDVWEEVDFGEGPVRVRCTRVGDHNTHSCLVLLSVGEIDRTTQQFMEDHNGR